MTGYIFPLSSPNTQLSQSNPVSVAMPLQACNLFSVYSLQWRQNILWVSVDAPTEMSENKVQAKYLVQQIYTRLERSSVQAVCIDPKVGETHLKTWAEACKQAGKPVYLRVPGGATPKSMSPSQWTLKRFLDVSATLLGCLIISPILCVIAMLVKMSSPGPIFYQQWRVGNRGKLYQVWKFRSMVANAESLHHQVMGSQQGLHKQENDPRITPIGYWLRKYSLDELPQLINVLKGEMSLVGPRPWAFYDALQVPNSSLERLRAMPGITGEWQVMARSNLRDMHSVTQCDLAYLKGWSIKRDLQLLMMTFPKVITGFGAF
ncbi:MAG: heterocyst development glycosyltransferase HepC [Phormidesmis sp.]